MKTTLLFLALLVSLSSCKSTDLKQINNTEPITYLALGDSYTIGESVCGSCRFPEQLKDAMETALKKAVELQIIATTGWTTTQLKKAITTQNPRTDNSLVTLLIGVNNQYQNLPFETYENEFPELLNTAIIKADGDKNRVIVISIPDYAFTPYGNGNTDITEALEAYNAFAENYCLANNISFISITDITQNGLKNPNLVAKDGLHPSTEAYTHFVKRLLPVALKKLK